MQKQTAQDPSLQEDTARRSRSSGSVCAEERKGTEAPAFSGKLFFFFGVSDNRLDRLLSLCAPAPLRAFRHGVMLLMPLLLGAAIAILVSSFPLAVYQDFMADVFGPNWKSPAVAFYNSSIEILAIIAAITLSDRLIASHNQKRPDQEVPPVMGTLTTVSCLFIMIGPRFGAGSMILPWSGIRGITEALIISCAACSLFVRLCRVRRLRPLSHTEGADHILPHIFNTLLPALCTMFVFLAVREALSASGIAQALQQAAREVFLDAGDSLGLGALYVFLVDLSWFFGTHGTDLLDPISHSMLIKGMELNSIAINAYEAPSHIFTKYFFEVYIFLGGSGVTLGLLAAVFLRSRDHGTRRTAALALIPGIFNINELLIFGLPIVLNPIFLLPFVLAPVLLLFISYLAVQSGLVPLPVYQVDWITPPLISGYLATGSWRGLALQLFNLAVATLMYVPFVQLADMATNASRRRAFQELARIAESGTRGPSGKRCTDRSGDVGALARSLSNDMLRDLRSDNEFIHLCFQPRINLIENSVPCVEALLRWKHPFYGYVPPTLALAIAEDADLIRQLDTLVVRMAFEQQAEWRKNGLFTTVSINLSESQLQDKDFPAMLALLFSSLRLPAGTILCEVRESLALHPDGKYLSALKAIHATGVYLAIDDFGKSYQTLSQLDLLPLDELQIEHSLVIGVSDNPLHQNILCNIQEMCFQKGIKTSAEYIESREQLETLLELNFSTFQGYHFSEPVRADKCAEFIRTFASDENSR